MKRREIGHECHPPARDLADGAPAQQRALAGIGPFHPPELDLGIVPAPASAPGDFTAATSQTVTIPAGQTSATITIPTINDALSEGAETFSVQIAATLAGAALTANKATATATIAVSDQPPPVSAAFQAVVASAQDDIELGFSVNSPDLETDKVVQLRFTVGDGAANVANVDSAVISWQAERTHGGTSTLTFQVENSLNAQPFGTGKSFVGGPEVVQISGTWQDNAIITNVVDIADQLNALIASQGPLNAGDTINLQITGSGATRYIVQATAEIDISAGGDGSTGLFAAGVSEPFADDAIGDETAPAAVETTKDENGSQILTVFAGGTGGPATSPQFRVVVDGVVISTETILSPQTTAEVRANGIEYDAFEFMLTGPAPAEVDIVYINDGRDPVSDQDLNLYIDKIVLDGQTFESEIDGLFTHAGGVTSRNVASEDMLWNGTLSFDVDQIV